MSCEELGWTLIQVGAYKIKPNNEDEAVKRYAWYNENITYAILSQVDIEYTDGEKIFIDAGNIKLEH